MRFLMQVTMPVEAGNASIKNGTLPEKIGKILGDIKPEAAYFTEIGGNRCGMIIVDMKETSQMPRLAEPWFLAFNASVEFHPVMTPEDLKKAGPDIGKAVKDYA